MKKILALAAALLIIISAAACRTDKKGDYPVILGNYTFEKRPDSIVCLSDSIADILISCGYADLITARSDECTQREIADVPSVGSKAFPSADKILSFSPDIVFADRSIADSIYDNIRDSGVRIAVMVPAEDSEGLIRLYSNISAVAEGNNKGRENGTEKANSILMTMSDLQRLVPEKDIVTTVCYIYDTKGTAATENSPAGRVLSYTDAVNVCGTSHTPEDTKKSIKLSNPDFIFCDTGIKSSIENDSDFKELRAVKNGHVYELDSLLIQRQGNSMVEALAFIIETMYPETNDPGVSETAQESSQPESSAPQEISQPESSVTQESSQPESSITQESSQPESSVTQESSQPEESSSGVEADDSLEIYDGLAYGEGEQNDDVYKIQERLRTLGYFENEPTGYFGSVTAEAFARFEAANGLDADGYASADDLRLLFSANAV